MSSDVSCLPRLYLLLHLMPGCTCRATNSLQLLPNKQRCLNQNHHAYQLYGAIGITVCDEWKDFTNFLKDMGVRPEGTSINRINGAMVYSSDTCEWATYSVQAYDQKIRATNKSGVTGVCWDKRLDKWEAYISVDKKKISLGFYEEVSEAASARKSAEIKYYGFTKQ